MTVPVIPDVPAISGLTNQIVGHVGTTHYVEPNVDGSLPVSLVGGERATYSASIKGLVPADSCTDLVSLIGSATTIVRVTRVEITGQTTAVTGRSMEIQLVKRSTASTTSGVSTGSPTAVPHDSNDAAATAVMYGWTTCNTSLGTLVGTALRNRQLNLNLITDTATDFPPQESLVWEFGKNEGQEIVLRGVAEQIAINLNGATKPAGGVFDIAIEWTEAAS
jgi:hypothetical protein